ncbi:MAG: FAD binding domain-containing protein [Anaerolineae bacterium]
MISQYFRPKTIDEALQLLIGTKNKTMVLASQLLPDTQLEETVEAVIDLQAVGLDKVEAHAGGLKIGAMTRLQTMVDDGIICDFTKEATHAESSSTFRNMQTIGAIVMNSDPESRLVATLLVLEAHLTILTVTGVSDVSLSEFLAEKESLLNGGILTSITVANDGKTASAHVSRTPADKPIVAAVGRQDASGRTLLALAGVARTPVLVEPREIDALEPPGDFRGSSAYRKQMAQVLSQRVLSEIG